MPSERDPIRAATAPAPPLPVRLLRLAANAIVALVAVGCLVLLAVRFVAFPRIEAHREDVAAAIAKRLGQPVSIAAIVTGWDGWNPRLSVRGFTVYDRAPGGAAVLQLPRVDLIVSWISLPLLDLRLKELAIESPRLAVRLDAEGLLHVAGIALDPAADRNDGALTDWMLRQPRIVVHDGLISWTDERRRAPQLVLDRVELRVEQESGEHHFGLTGVPPAELAGPLDLRGEFSAPSPREWRTARGRAYVRLDYADVGAWRPWLPLPIVLDRGQGALRLWFEFADGIPRALTADVELVDVRAQLGPDLPPVELAHLAGRFGGRQDEGRRVIDTRGLAFTARDGTSLPPTELHVRYDDPRDGTLAHGEFSVDRLELAPLTALAAHLPIAERWRGELAKLAPTGALRDARLAWDGPASAPASYRATAQFAGVGFAAVESAPGLSGVSGKLDASQAGGTLDVARGPLTVALPRVFVAPLAFTAAAARVSWTHADGATSVRIDEAVFANADIAGTVAGAWRSAPTGPGSVDVRAQLSRASVAPLPRYLPRQLSDTLREWLAHALVAGETSDVRLVLKGDLAEFPFPENRNGQFAVIVKARAATLDYATHWPPLRDVDAELRFEGARMTIDATRGQVLGASLDRTHVEIPDLRERPANLRVDGEVAGPTAEFLAFIAKSPVGEWINHAADSAQVTGSGRLALKFELPLNGSRATALAGDYQFTANQLRWAGAPTLTNLNGKLSFTDHDIEAHDLAAEVFGGPARLELHSGDGQVRIDASGNANVSMLHPEFDLPLVDRMKGMADWRLSLDSRPDALAWTIESPLRGVTIDLPAPLGKGTDDAVALKVVRREEQGGRADVLHVDYGGAARMVVHRRLAPGGASVDRTLVLLGTAVERPEDAALTGLSIRADVPSLNVDDWLAFQRNLETGEAGRATNGVAPPAPGLAIDRLEIEAGVLQALGRRFNELKVTGQRSGKEWRLALDGREVAGTAVWHAADAAQPNGRVVARLARLVPPRPGELVPWSGAVEAPSARAAEASNPWPAIDMTADAFFTRGRDVGRLEVLAEPVAADWRIAKLRVVNEAGRIDAAGLWRGGAAPQTSLEVKVDVQDAGIFLQRFAMPDAIRRTPTTVEGRLAWAGAPSDFDYPSLSGAFKVRSGAGQFLKADPGVGRLLGVLSLQALPRRISLDFRDVFSEGFAFDSVAGDVRIENGVMHTDQLKLTGPAAAVDIAGDVDLARETQHLRVRVQPSLSSSVSAGAAALFIANPLIGAAVGAGTLLAQKILNQPIEQLFSYEYGVSGGWDDPLVQRLKARTAAAWPETVTK